MDSNFISKPYIRLSGGWLEEAGFEIGRNYKVEVEGNKIMLQVIEIDA